MKKKIDNKNNAIIKWIVIIQILIIVPIMTILVINKNKINKDKSIVLEYISEVNNSLINSSIDSSFLSGTYYIDDNFSVINKIKIKDKIKAGTFTFKGKHLSSGKFCINNHSMNYEKGKLKYNQDFDYCNGELEYKEKTIGTIAQSLLDNNTTYGNYTYMGGTYLKGVQESNYVWYNGFLWRILGKNEDGTIRLITEENVGTGAWGSETTENWNESGYIKDWLNNYFYNNLDSSKSNIIQNSKWCIKTNSYENTRIDCTGGTLIESKVGLISLDEYNLSGASTTNKAYGLVNSQIFWTMTPNYHINYDGYITNSPLTFLYGIRPVINVSAESTVSRGSGELSNAYILNQSITSKTGKLNKKTSSGEYVSLNEKIYRVVSNNSEGTKLIYDGYYEEVAGTPYTMEYNETSTSSFSTNIEIIKKLNTDVLSWLGNSNKITESTWYQANNLDMKYRNQYKYQQSYGYDIDISYVDLLDSKDNFIITKVGLIRVGEMMSGISASILTKNYTLKSTSSQTAKSYWTINKIGDADHLIVSSIGSINRGYNYNYKILNTKAAIRPVIVVNNDTMITSGNGTLQNPYIID